MLSAAESKPISCVPGCAPARLELVSIGRSKPAAFICSTSLSSVPEGASFLVMWWISHAHAPYSFSFLSKRAASETRRVKTLTPIEKFGLQTSAESYLATIAFTSARCSAQPVVPTTIGMRRAATFATLPATEDGTENSTATSAPSIGSSRPISTRAETVNPYSGASWSIKRPILPYPTMARLGIEYLRIEFTEKLAMQRWYRRRPLRHHADIYAPKSFEDSRRNARAVPDIFAHHADDSLIFVH